VVGNTHYTGVNALKNPENDARAMAHTLQALGFDVLMCLDRTNKQMDEDIDAFGAKAASASVALFYFSGHGAQLAGENYLIPIGFDGHSESAIKYDAVNMGRVLDMLRDAKAHVNVVILDACRDNPFTEGSRSLSRGLASVTAPGGTLICYATAPGKTAADNAQGANGLYTQALLTQMKVPGQRIEDVFINVRKAVRQASGGKQVPWEESSLEDAFYFIAPSGNGLLPAAVPPSAGSIKINPQDGAEMVYVPAGPFLMGDDDREDNKRHTVTLSGYYIYKNLVTVGMYRRYCEATGKVMPDPPRWGWKDDHPMVKMTWDEAKAYCEWAGGKLPTEAQWEKAARGTDGRKYPWGDEFDQSKLWASKAEFRDAGSTAPVGSFPAGASPYGVLDMAGNAWQWCEDWYDKELILSSTKQPGNSANDGLPSDLHVLRGGSWGDRASAFVRSLRHPLRRSRRIAPNHRPFSHPASAAASAWCAAFGSGVPTL
jgi:formylglycine-generating enzyme required for sulfatase activity